MRRQKLYGPRVYGDFIPGTDPANISGASAAAWAKEVFPGEQIAGQTDQSIYEDSTTQKFELGSRRQEYFRTFRYSKSGAALGGLARLLTNANYAPGVTGHADEDGFEGVLNAAASIGDLYVDLADTTVRAANYYKGGFLVIYGTTVFHQYIIVKSDAGTGVYVRCYLDKAIYEEDVTVAMGVTAYISPYSAIQQVGSVQAGFEAAMGVNLVPVASGSYFWMQTRGPAIVTPTGVTWPGSAANLRAVYMNKADGTLQPATISDPSSGFQYIGYVLSATGGTGSDYGDLWIWLELE
jgi:hypothetical protein